MAQHCAPATRNGFDGDTPAVWRNVAIGCGAQVEPKIRGWSAGRIVIEDVEGRAAPRRHPRLLAPGDEAAHRISDQRGGATVLQDGNAGILHFDDGDLFVLQILLHVERPCG
jgi:hypothetical protein